MEGSKQKEGYIVPLYGAVPDSVRVLMKLLMDASERLQATKSQFLLGNTFCHSRLEAEGWVRGSQPESWRLPASLYSGSRLFEQEIAPLCGRKLHSIQQCHPKCSTKNEGALQALPSTAFSASRLITRGGWLCVRALLLRPRHESEPQPRGGSTRMTLPDHRKYEIMKSSMISS